MKTLLRLPATISRYAGLWCAYIRINWLALMAYNVDFIISNTANLVHNVAQILAVGIIFQHIGSIAGWSFDQVLYLYALAALGRSLWHLFFVSVLTIGQNVRTGEFERLLVRPANVLFQLVANYLDNDDWGEAVIGIVLLGHSVGRLGLIDSPLDILVIALQVMSAVAIYLALHLAANTLSFWLVRGRAAESIVWQLDNFSRYPLTVYSKPLKALLTWVVPFGFVNFYPAQVFFGSGAMTWIGWLSPLVGLLAFALAYRFWEFGLSWYQGTGS